MSKTKKLVLILSLCAGFVFLVSWSRYGFRASFVGLLPLFMLYLIVFAAFSFPVIKGTLKTIRRNDAILSAFILVLFGVSIYLYISSEHFIYYWDYGSYWYQGINVASELFSDPIESAISVMNSINSDDYNHLLGLMMSVPLSLFGGTYPVFILLTYIMFFVPTALVLSVTARTLGQNAGMTTPLSFFIFLACCFPMLVVPLLDGYIDIAAVMLIGVCLLVTVSCDFTKLNVRAALIIALSLIGILLMRRYFAYWVVGYVMFAVCYCAFDVARAGAQKKNVLSGYGVNFIVVGVVCLTILLVFFRGFLLKSIFSDYASAYSAYDSGGGLEGKIVGLFNIVGVTQSLMCIVGFILSFRRKRARKIFMSLIVLMASASLLFWRTQDMGTHHYYILAAEFYILTALSAILIFQALKEHLVVRRMCFCLFILYLCVSIVHMFGFFEKDDLPVFGAQQHKLAVRNDIDQINALGDSLRPEDSVYVVASSGVFNADLFYKSFFVRGETFLAFTLLNSSDIDLWHGFSIDFFQANTLIVCEPVQTHTADPNDQAVVLLLADLIADDKSVVGKHFDKIRSYQLEGGVEAAVYQKIDEYSVEDIREVERLYDEKYPDYPELFHNRFEEYIANKGGTS